MDSTQSDRSSIENVLLKLRPILEEKDVIGRTIKMTELAKICHNHRHRLPIRGYRAKQMSEEIRGAFRGSSSFQLGDLDISLFTDFDRPDGRKAEMIEFQYSVSKEQQYLTSLQSTPTHETPTKL